MDQETDPTRQTEHERKVAQVEEGGTGEMNAEDDAYAGAGNRPTSEEDLAADQGLDDQESEGLG